VERALDTLEKKKDELAREVNNSFLAQYGGANACQVTTALDSGRNFDPGISDGPAEQMGRPIAYTGVEIATAIKRSRYLTRISTSVLGEGLIYRLNPFSSSPGTIPSSPSTEVLMRVK
jgi:hypothetical protein